ncbi:hypothetical protein D0T84_06410 [Dysgonomonas sp. 521]|uniref:hypothetical protein n=1 Tax=Dysgonomonas sp. 521 TaxID=2302932 RepID=UPI0013D8A7F1|nr:hypothetical protein [Dysgonomonas sp. 521]NDV94554.1 hypothetical protein [Dysgonomonas sp. 521]
MSGIEKIKEFSRLFYEKSNGIFLDPADENIENTVCEINLSSDIVLILPRTKDLSNIRFYKNVKIIEINNYKIDRAKYKILEQNANLLKQVTHLQIWNNKQDDLSLLKLFPNLTHLQISYIRKDESFFKELESLRRLQVLWLFSPSRLENLQFLRYVKSDLVALGIESTKALKSFSGLGNVPSLQYLSLWGSTYESAKFVTLDNTEGIESLQNLTELELKFYKFDMDDLERRLKGLKSLTNYTVDKNIYQNG